MSSIATGTNVVLPQMSLSDSIHGITGPHRVVINVYDLHKSNQYLFPMGTGFYHTGVQVGDVEYCFSMGGISNINPRSYENLGGGATFKEQV